MEIEITAKIDKREEEKFYRERYDYNLPKFEFVTS